MAGGGDNSQTNGGSQEPRAMEEGRKEDYDQGCGLAISLPFVQKVSPAPLRSLLGFINPHLSL